MLNEECQKMTIICYATAQTEKKTIYNSLGTIFIASILDVPIKYQIIDDVTLGRCLMVGSH